ncbi:MAG: hypothetical protein V3R57_04045 [Candidatus Bathyarchaeia archaeon]
MGKAGRFTIKKKLLTEGKRFTFDVEAFVFKGMRRMNLKKPLLPRAKDFTKEECVC